MIETNVENEDKEWIESNLSTESTGVFGVLCYFDLFDHFSERRAISGAVLSNYSYFLCPLCLPFN